MLEDPGPDSSHFFDLLLGGDDDGGALHLDVKLLGLVLPAVEADLEFVVVILDTGMWKALKSKLNWIELLARYWPIDFAHI